MTDLNIKEDESKNISTPEKKVAAGEQAVKFKQEGYKAPEKREVSPDEEIVSDELKRELEKMEFDPVAKADIEKTREKIEYLGEKEKIEHLLKIAREKGLFFAIQVAKKMNEPYLLDTLHDVLAREGFYKKIIQTNSDDNQAT